MTKPRKVKLSTVPPRLERAESARRKRRLLHTQHRPGAAANQLRASSLSPSAASTSHRCARCEHPSPPSPNRLVPTDASVFSTIAHVPKIRPGTRASLSKGRVGLGRGRVQHQVELDTYSVDVRILMAIVLRAEPIICLQLHRGKEPIICLQNCTGESNLLPALAKEKRFRLAASRNMRKGQLPVEKHR